MEGFITLYVMLVVALGRKLRRNSTFPWWVDTGISWSRYNRVRKMAEWRCESSRLGLTTDLSMVW